MENIKDYILQKDAEDINAMIPAPPPKPKAKVSYETLFASGPDFAVRRKTSKTSMVMVIIVSKAQFYIKDESAGGTVHDLYEDNLQKFVSGIPEAGYTIQDAEGNTPNWIGTLQRDSYWREKFLGVLCRKELYPYMKNDMFDFQIVLDSYYTPTFYREDFSAIKSVFGIVADHLGRDEAKKLVMANSGVFLNCSRSINTITGTTLLIRLLPILRSIPAGVSRASGNS